MSPIDHLDGALEAYRKALYQTSFGNTPPDPEAFARNLSDADRSSFLSAVKSVAAYVATADVAPAPEQTLDSDPPTRPDRTGEFNKETQSLGGETPDPNRVTRTQVVGRHSSSERGDFEVDSPTRSTATNPVDRLEEYEILGELGHGGMGVVYKARQKALNRVCALKMVLAGGRASAQQLARFTAEARAVAKLDHPNIVRVYDIGDHDGLPFFAMEYVAGGPLDALLKKQSLEPKAAARLVETVCRAMHYAHQKGIIHRDLKPANILLTVEDKAPKITDFGLAKQLDDESDQATRTGAVMGTPNYMAPEQAEGKTKDVTALADVYAIGATLYELITGRPPFQGPSAVAVLAQVRSNEPVNPSRLQPGVPKDLETICLKAMQKEAFKRYPSAESMADDLKRYIDGQPILARPISTVEHFVRWCKRKPAQAGLAVSTGVLAVLLVASGIAYGANLRHKNGVIERQNHELEDKNAALAKERDEVKAQAESNAEKVRFLLRNTATDLKLLGLTRQREALVQFIFGDLKRIEGLSGDSAGVDDRARVGVYLTLGDIYFENAVAAAGEKRKDHLERAGEEFGKAVALTERVAAEKPTSDLANGQWALALARRGEFLLQTGHSAEAAVDLDRAYRLRKSVRESPQSVPGSRDYLFPADRVSSLAESYQLLCGLPEVAADKTRSAEYLKAFVGLSEKALAMVESDPKATEEPAGLLMFRRRLGNAYVFAARKSPTEARAYFEKARAVREKVAAEVPDSIPDRAALAETIGKLGDEALFADDPKAAAILYEQMLGHLGKTVSPTDARRQWGMAYYRVATAQLMAGDAKTALSTYRKSVAVREDLAKDSGLARDYWGLMVSLARTGEHERAVGVAEEVATKFPPVPDYFFNAACTYAICAGSLGDGRPDDKLAPDQLQLRTAYLGKAWTLIEKTFETKSRRGNEIPTDPDLAYLRTRPDYKEKLEAAKKAK